MDTFSIATYNVHMWSDADYHDNFDRVINVVKVTKSIDFLKFSKKYVFRSLLPISELVLDKKFQRNAC